MKKFISTLILLIIYLSLTDSKIISVFSEIEEKDIYKNYYVEIDNLNSFNYNDYFKELDVVGIIPYINKLYKDKINIIYLDNDIEKLKKIYIKRFKEKGYYKEANKYLIMPIRIDKVIVCSSINQINSKIDSDIVKISEVYVKKYD